MRLLILLILFAIVCTASCSREHPHFTAEFRGEPDKFESGKPVNLIFQIKGPNGEKVSELESLHEQPMHLYMVSEDLAQYFHDHPAKQADGTYRLPFTFPNGGKFKIFIDFKPVGGEQSVETFDVEVGGYRIARVDLIPDKKFEQTVDGLRFEMKPDIALVKQKDVTFTYRVFDSQTGKPAEDLEDYLGEKGHFTIIRKGLGRFVHVHPMSGEKHGDEHSGHDTGDSKKNPEGAKNSEIRAMTNFPNSGIYKIFAQFKRNGRIITVPFVVEVK